MFHHLLEKLARREDLSMGEASAAMAAIMEGLASDAEMAGFLTALAMKGEQPEEIVGLATAMRDRAVKLSKPYTDVVDLCGTGGDRTGTFNVSSMAAIVVAACGVRVAKHGNRSVSSRCGSADLFDALGVQAEAPPGIVERMLDEAGMAFLFAPAFHPSMRRAASVRRALGLRTAFNLLGPLTNPVRPRWQVVGVPRPELTELMARALLLLGCERAWVVHGADGLDEISIAGYTKVSECRLGTVNTFYVHPSDYRLPRAAPESIRGGDAPRNAAIARGVLEGSRGAARDIVTLNAGAALLVSGMTETVGEGIAMAADAIDSLRALRVLDRMVELSGGAA
jgi:anthranilate phosphoribosyltransferase